MSRRTLPPIAPTDLRDHADEDRIDRIWNRIEHDLNVTLPSPRRSNSLAVMLVAAAFAAFGGGLLIGKLWREPAAMLPPTPSPDRPAPDILAAGSQPRTFALPGGGEITLRAGATVEVERSDGDALTLRLVQGETTVDADTRPAAFSMIVGDARLASKAGSALRVRRDANQMDVDVTSGSVSLTSPTVSRELKAGQRVDSVPLHAVTAVVAPNAPRHDKAPAPSVSPVEGQPPGEPPPVAVAAPPDWRAAWDHGDSAAALSLLRGQPGGIAGAIAAAKDANQLWDISYVARSKGGDPGQATAALTKIVDTFPNDPSASLAAFKLGEIYEKAGQSTQAQQYFNRAKSTVSFADDASCRQLRGERRSGNKDEVVRLVKEYLAK